MAFWTQNGKIVVDSSGHVVECSTCPCGGGDVPGTNCTNCTTGTMPSQRLADFGGAGTPTCCAGINLNTDTFLLAQTDVCTLGYSDDCNASIPMTIGLNFFSTGLVVKIFHESDGSFIEFHKNYSALPNCMSESVGSIPYGTHNFGGVCGFSSNMTCSLSVP